MFFSAPSGLVFFCRDHIPAGFVQDPLSLVWVPQNVVSPLFLLLQKWQEMKTATRILANYVEKTVRERQRLTGLVQEVQESIHKLQERLDKRVYVEENEAMGGVTLHVDRLGMPEWFCRCVGVGEVANRIRASHARVEEGGCWSRG